MNSRQIACSCAPLTALLSALALCAPAMAQTSPALTRDDMRSRVAILAADSMLGRDAGQIGNVKATNYVAAELRKLGLTAAGENGFFQTIPLITRGAMRGASVTVAGVTFDSTAIVSSRAVNGAPFGGRFNGSNVPTVYGGAIGREIVSPADVRGKVVVFQAAQTADGSVNGNGFAGNGVLAPYAAARAAGILIIGLEKLPPQFVANNLAIQRVVLADTSVDHFIPAALITAAVANEIFGPGTPAVGAAGKPVSGMFGMNETPTPAPARNVIGILRGTDPKLRNEFVAIGAHTDHVGVGRPVDHDSVRAANEVLRPLGANGQPRQATQEDRDRISAIRASLAKDHAPRLDSIFNGADDDASGTAVALELAEYFAKHPPKRSLLFVFHTAEEKGLYGAAYFTDHPTVNRDSIVMQLNMDQLSRGGPNDVAGSTPNTVFLLGTRRLSTTLGDLVETINNQPNHKLNLDYTLDQPGHPANGYCRSDHYMYARYGIPIVFFTAGWHRDYHMVTDEVQYIQPETMLAIGSLAQDLVSSVANAANKPVVDHPKPDPRGTCRQ